LIFRIDRFVVVSITPSHWLAQVAYVPVINLSHEFSFNKLLFRNKWKINLFKKEKTIRFLNGLFFFWFLHGW